MEYNGSEAMPPSPIDPKTTPMTMPGTKEEAAGDIASVGVEGPPANPRSGPRHLWLEIAIAVIIVFALVGVITWILGWAAGAVALAFAAIAFVMNPEIVATAIRARDRQKVVKEHEPKQGRTIDSHFRTGP